MPYCQRHYAPDNTVLQQPAMPNQLHCHLGAERHLHRPLLRGFWLYPRGARTQALSKFHISIPLKLRHVEASLAACSVSLAAFNHPGCLIPP